MLTDPIAEYNIITQWLGQFIEQTTTPKQFANRLRRFLNQRHKIKLEAAYLNEVLEPNDFTVAALYDVWGDEQGKTPIILTFFINHPLDQPWLITSTIADQLALDIIEALVHEYQHLYQYRMRDHMLNGAYESLEEDLDLRAEQEYLGQMDEIDAYAVNIAVRQYVRKDTQSLDLDKYRRVFGSDHRVVRRLLKKISKQLHRLYLNNHYTSTET